MRGLSHCELFRSLFVREDETLSPSARVPSIDELIDPIVSKLVDQGVELCVYRFQFDLRIDTIHAPIGMPVLTNAIGESVWFFIRSFMDGQETHLRAIEPMVPGEIRHVILTTTVPESVFRVGQTSLVVAYMPDANEFGSVAHVEPQSHAVYGLSCLPLLFLNWRLTAKQRKKRSHVHGYPLLFCQSLDAQSKRDGKLVVATYKDFSLYTTAEWALGAPKPGKYPPTSTCLPRVSDLEFASALKLFETRTDAHLKALEAAHAHDVKPRLPPETVLNRTDSIEASNLFAEFTTLGAWVDLLASGSLSHLPFQLWSDPFQLPLFLAVSLFSAAMPVQLKRRVGAKVDSEDDEVILNMMQLFHAHVTSPSLLEMLIQSELEQLFKRARAETGGTAAGDFASNVPVATEHLRRGGLALAHELVGLPPRGFEEAHIAAQRESMPTGDEDDDRRDDHVPKVLRHLASKRRAAYRGSARHARARAMRVTSVDERLRVVVTMLVELNSMLHTGVFQGKEVGLFLDPSTSVSLDDSDEDEGEFVVVPKMHTTKQLLDETSVRICSSAWRATAKQSNLYLMTGPSILASFSMNNNAILTLPARPRTRYSCGKCNKRFHIFETIAHQRLSQCLTCACFFCCECYDSIVEIANKQTGKATMTAQDILPLRAKNPGLFLCKECGA